MKRRGFFATLLAPVVARLLSAAKPKLIVNKTRAIGPTSYHEAWSGGTYIQRPFIYKEDK